MRREEIFFNVGKCGIYIIKNISNDKAYIGQSSNISKRIHQHKYYLNNGVHSNPYLQNAWNKYGKENFVFETLEICNICDLDDYEKYFISLRNSLYPNGYNLTSGGKEGFLVPSHSKKKKRSVDAISKTIEKSRETRNMKKKIIDDKIGKQKTVLIFKKEVEKIIEIDEEHVKRVLLSCVINSRIFNFENPEIVYFEDIPRIVRVSMQGIITVKSFLEDFLLPLNRTGIINIFPESNFFKLNFLSSREDEIFAEIDNFNDIRGILPDLFRCKSCKKFFKKTGRGHKFCKDCYDEKERERKRIWARNNR